MFVTAKTDLKQLNVVPIAKIHFKFAASNFYNLCVQDGSFLRSCLKHIPVRETHLKGNTPSGPMKGL